MPKKKATGLKHIHFRLKPDEAAAIEEDRKALPGIPVAASAYAKHAVLSYPKLRKLEDAVRKMARNGGSIVDTSASSAGELLAEAGL